MIPKNFFPYRWSGWDHEYFYLKSTMKIFSILVELEYSNFMIPVGPPGPVEDGVEQKNEFQT